jgi:hypothetical protein
VVAVPSDGIKKQGRSKDVTSYDVWVAATGNDEGELPSVLAGAAPS